VGLEKFTRFFLDTEYESTFQANGTVATELQWDASLQTGCVSDAHLRGGAAGKRLTHAAEPEIGKELSRSRWEVSEEGESDKTVLKVHVVFAQIRVIPEEGFVIQDRVQPGRTLFLRKAGGEIGEVDLERYFSGTISYDFIQEAENDLRIFRMMTHTPDIGSYKVGIGCLP
jgi:hypothetical protein